MSRPIITERTVFAGIPALHVRSAGLEGPAPTILYYHGWSSFKEKHIITAEALAIDGFRLILPDAPRHGERDPLPEYGSTQAWMQYWAIVWQAMDEATAIKDELVQRGLADPERIGLGGHSMGGMIGSTTLARNDWAKAAAFASTNLTHSVLDRYGRASRQELPATAAELALLREHDPEALIDQIAPRPLLLMHGTEDKTLPIAEIRRWVALARPAYAAHPDRLHLEEYPGLGHHIIPMMVMQMRDWFLKYL